MRWIRFLDATTVCLTIGAIASVGVFIRRDGRKSVPVPKASVVPDWRSYSAHGIRLGPDQAEVVVVVFSDIRCLHCRKAWASLAEARRKYPEHLAVVYRHYPLIAFGLDAPRAGLC